MKITPETLTAYLDGELDEQQAMKVRESSLGDTQLAYLHGGDTPVAFCITPDGAPDAGLASDTREGLPIVHWAKNAMSNMVIGDIPNEQLVGMAEALRSQL